jgi:exopolyphosphatase/guanosine-5'-triphosphate,3'-diphosphate pyrophosphatase
MGERPPLGAISIGSNDIHLLVATSDGIGTFERKANQSMLAELVGAVRGGVVPAKALSQALLDLETLVTQARNAGASPIIALATEAMREVANSPAFIELVGTTLGIQAVLISGEEEAALDYSWATFPPVPPSPLLVVDSGGGSTQAILGNGPTPAFAQSLPVGAGNMTKQFVDHDPPTNEEIEALSIHVATLVGTLPLMLAPQSAILMGGSADHLLQFAADPGQHKVTQEDLQRALHELRHKSAREIAHDYHCPEERVHLLAAGAVILGHVLSHYHFDEAYVKPNGIRGGLVVSYARHQDGWRQALPILPAVHPSAHP